MSCLATHAGASDRDCGLAECAERDLELKRTDSTGILKEARRANVDGGFAGKRLGSSWGQHADGSKEEAVRPGGLPSLNDSPQEVKAAESMCLGEISHSQLSSR